MISSAEQISTVKPNTLLVRNTNPQCELILLCTETMQGFAGKRLINLFMFRYLSQ